MKNDGIVECQDAAGDYPGPADSLSLIRPAQARLGQSDVRRHLGGGDWRGEEERNQPTATALLIHHMFAPALAVIFLLRLLVASKDFSHKKWSS